MTQQSNKRSTKQEASNYTMFTTMPFLLLAATIPTLDFFNLPATSPDCSAEEAFCQMYHKCVDVSDDCFRKFSFVSPNGTVFSQEDPWEEQPCLPRPPATPPEEGSETPTPWLRSDK